MFKQRKYKHFGSVITSFNILFEDIYDAAPPECRALVDSMTGEELVKYISTNQRRWADIIATEVRQRTAAAFKETVSKALRECIYNNPLNFAKHAIH